jgi:fructan beta-fructosidase
MNILKTTLSLLLLLPASTHLNAEDLSLKITKRYLNIPVSHQVDRQVMKMEIEGQAARTFDIRLAPSNPDYWVFCDLSSFKGKTLTLSYPDGSLLKQIYQDDRIAGEDSLYREAHRPQLHFSPRRGWNNDPNGLIFYEGEYHLFYQHNPYEREWGNMHWGHAVSRDLIHWEELPIALYPDELGTMFSGSAVIDYDNTAGFNKAGLPAMIAVYTADSPEKQVQCMAYSLDKGRTWTKYQGNPLIDSKEKWDSKDTRDPHVFRYAPTNEWVMALNERDGHSIYTSPDLKSWTFRSHITGFWECPQLFELPVDGDKSHTRWVMYGASGTYMIGDFDGRVFTPESGKHYYTTGSLYAAQTFANIPASDGRRIQIGWGRIETPPLTPFNMLMLLPTELSLRTGKDGIRLYNTPVKEFDQLQAQTSRRQSLTSEEASAMLQAFNTADRLRIKTTIRLSHATEAGLSLSGQELLRYDLNYNLVNGVFYSPNDPTSMEITADIIIDKTCIEVFIDGGAYSFAMPRESKAGRPEGFSFFGHKIEVKDLEVSTLHSIWK